MPRRICLGWIDEKTGVRRRNTGAKTMSRFFEKQIEKLGKCGNCHGSGTVHCVEQSINGTIVVKILDGTQLEAVKQNIASIKRTSHCDICNGKGWRDSEYGKDKFGVEKKNNARTWHFTSTYIEKNRETQIKNDLANRRKVTL